MDIGQLYQEYQSFSGPQSSTQNERQLQSSLVQNSLFRSIQQAMPNLLAPHSPRSSRLSASLPPSAEDDRLEDGAAVGAASSPLRQQRLQQRHSHIASLAGRRAQHEEPQEPAPDAESLEELCSPLFRNLPVQNDRVSDRQKQPLVVIDPKDVKTVLTQVVTSTMRDLLGRDQEVRERCLLRKIKRMLGQFEASISASQFAVSKHHRQPQPGSQRICPPVANHSASSLNVISCGLAAAGTSSKDSGKTIWESCCWPSDDRTTGSARVALGESDADCKMPPRYRPPSSLYGTDGSGEQELCRQKNYNHSGCPEGLQGCGRRTVVGIGAEPAALPSTDDILALGRKSSMIANFPQTVGQMFPRFSGPDLHSPGNLQSTPVSLQDQSSGCEFSAASDSGASDNTADSANASGGSAVATRGSTGSVC